MGDTAAVTRFPPAATAAPTRAAQPGRQRVWAFLVATALVAGLGTAGCSSGVTAASGIGAGGVQQAAPSAAVSSAVVMVDPGDPDLPTRPDRPITVQVADGRLTDVSVTSEDGQELAGALANGDSRWQSSDELLAFGGSYTVVAQAVDQAGVATTVTRTVKVADPETVSASVGVRDGATVGIGMPVVVRLSESVADRAAVERRLSVTTTPSVDGAWNWISDREVHYRPQNYWTPGTEITVKADLDGVRLGDQQWGEGSIDRTYSIGSSHIYRVNVDTHQMDVIVDGAKVGTLPITTGKAGFLTRNGVKVIMSKETQRRMRSETVDIPRNSSEGYDLEVKWAMRLTNSGEFIHAAPWSVRSQGRANVSHGCTGMSTANAKWLYDLSRVGDVVEYTGSPRPMTLTNGYGDWNDSWADWQAGSALT
jgi:lipoprotein-anchoring transpeptidase ErfK/SrfK